jgi:adenylyltransferase/sulfurtransferase
MKTTLSQEEILRYSRHLMVPEVGLSGQEKLKKSSVLIVGAGGLGAPVSLYLAAAGIGRLGLVDFDVVDSSNLQRQIVHGESQIDRLKVDSAKLRLSDLNPLIEIETYSDYISAANIAEIAGGYDIIVDGTDNFATRYLLNDYCVFNKKPYVYGSVFRFEGQVSVFDATKGPCYRCIFPSPPPAGLIPTCGEGGVFGVLPGTIGTMQATQVLKIILGIGEPAYGKLFLYDALNLSLQEIKLRKNPACSICGADPTIINLEDTAVFCALHEAAEEPVPAEWQIEATHLAEVIKAGENMKLIDVRDPVEREIVTIPGSVNIPYENLISRSGVLDKETPTVFICRNGIRSQRVVRRLRAQGYENVLNLKGGTNGWVSSVEPEKLKY